MKVELLVSRAGLAGAFGPGDVIEVDADEAVRMFAADQAVPVRDEPVEIAAASSAPETAARRRKGR
jgi:hypothetical protein